MRQELDLTAFMRQGLDAYLEARETVQFFEEQLQEAFTRTFHTYDAKRSWRHFLPENGKLVLRPGIGTLFRQIFALGTIPARNIERQSALAIGVYWNPPFHQSAPVVAFTNCWIAQGGGPVQLPDPAPGSGLTLRHSSRGDVFYVMEKRDDFDLDEALATLLREIDAALGPLSTETRA